MIENSQPKTQVLQPSAPPTRSISLVTRPRKILRAVIIGLTLISVYSLVTLNNANLNIIDALHSLGLNLNAMFLHPSVGQDTLGQLLRALMTSVSLAMLTTLLGALIAFFIAVGAARNLAPSWLATSIKAVMAFIRAIPLGRLGQPDDLASAIAFFLSDDASFITGQILSVSGGLTMNG